MMNPRDHGGFGLIEVMISISLSVGVMFFVFKMIEMNRQTQVTLDISSEAANSAAQAELVMRNERMCACNLRGLRWKSKSDRIPVNVNLWSGDCSEKKETIAENGMRPGRGIRYKSLTLQDMSPLTARTYLANVRLELEKLNSKGSFGSPVLLRDVVVSLTTHFDVAHGDTVVDGCGSFQSGERLVGLESIYKEVTHDEVTLKWENYPQATYALVTVHGTRFGGKGMTVEMVKAAGEHLSDGPPEAPPAPTKSALPGPKPKSGEEPTLGSDLEQIDMIVDFRTSTVRGTYLFAGGPQGTLTSQFPFTANLGERSQPIQAQVGKPCFWNRSVGNSRCILVSGVYQFVRPEFSVGWQDNKVGTNVTFSNLSAGGAFDQVWDVRYYK